MVECGRVGFREIRIDDVDGGIRFLVNGVPTFCRGACWTTNDIVALTGDGAALGAALQLAADAHANMIRVGGTMVYESDDFYRLCDELGIMVWQDFMFANMDYPVDDEAFADTVRDEAVQQLRRLQRHPSVVAYCGGSEVEQQAAMFGAERDVWSNAFFSETLPGLVQRASPDTPYWRSTPTGGSFPFHVGDGLTHYYGVGAYKRPLQDVRLAGVRFTPECLGFSNVPEADDLAGLTARGAVAPHDPAWKAGVPRDSGAGWDFEDIRDHYLERLYDVHAVEMRSRDPDRYLTLSRTVTGEVMERVFDEWRAETDGCGGALVWFYNDLRPGAGWGILDSGRRPKAVYHHLRRAWSPRCVRLLDRGLDGLQAIVLNERAEALSAVVELVAFARGSVAIAEARREVTVPGRSSARVAVEEAFGHFLDSTYSYRFGPPRHEAVVARLLESGAGEGGRLLSEDAFRPVRSEMSPGVEPACRVERTDADMLLLHVTAPSILYDVRIDVRDFAPEDDHLCLTPGRERSIRLVRTADTGRAFRGYLEALNLVEAVRLSAPE